MATTTNYGWTTPDDTALVKDGASAIRTLGSSVDTTTKNLNPETTLGDISYRSSTANVNTRLPLGTAGQVLKVNSGATAPEWATDASGMTNPMTTTGDTIYSSSGSTPARLAIGTANQQLRVNAGATAPEWFTPAAAASGMTLIQRSTFTNVSGTGTTFDGVFTSTYKSYQVMIERIGVPVSPASQIRMVLRNSAADSSTNYDGNSNYGAHNSNTLTGEYSANQSFFMLSQGVGGDTDSTMSCGQLFFNKVGTGSSVKPIWTGLFYSIYSQKNHFLGCTTTSAINADGFRLYSTGGNVSGTIAIYGLAV